MLSSGKSKAKREAKKAEQAAYLKALDGITPAERLKSAKTQEARKLQDENPDIDYSSVRLAMKADRLARESNKLIPQTNEAIDAYNNRVAQFQRQRNGESITEYSANPRREKNSIGIGAALMRPQAGESYTNMADAQSAVDRMNSEPVKQNGGILGQSQQYKSPLSQQDPIESASVREVKQGPITNSYRSLAATKDAYNDFTKLNKSIQATSGTLESNSSAYDELAKKLKQNMQRQSPIIQPQGLLAGDLMSGSRTSETIG